MKIEIGATGSLVTGDVLDVNKQGLERALQDYEPRLYLKWNTRKKGGHGQWELRIRPDKKKIVEVIPYQGNTYCVVAYKENEFDNHVFNLDSLNYSLLARLRAADMWAKADYVVGKQHRISNYLDKAEDARYKDRYEAEKALKDERLYRLKQDKAVLADLKERILSGVNPNLLGHFWGRK